MTATTNRLARVTETRRTAEEAKEAAERAVVDAYEAGHSLSELAAAMNAKSLHTPRMVLRGQGVTLRPRGRAPSHPLANYQPDRTQEAT